MKNPFIKEQQLDGVWIPAMIAGVVSAGIVAWIFGLKFAADREVRAAQEAYNQQHKRTS